MTSRAKEGKRAGADAHKGLGRGAFSNGGGGAERGCECPCVRASERAQRSIRQGRASHARRVETLISQIAIEMVAFVEER